MDRQKIPALVIEHCLCDGCKIRFNELNDKIPQVHSIKFYTERGKATISGAVDPATVMEELAKEGIKPKILWEESSPINNHHQQKQIVFPEHSLHEQVHRSGSRVHCCEQVRESRGRSRSRGRDRSRDREKSSPINNHHQQRQTAFPEHSLREQVHQSGSRVHGGELVHQSESKSRSFSRGKSRTRVRSRERDSRNRSKSRVDRSKSRSRVSRSGSRTRVRVSRSGIQSRVNRSESKSRVSQSVNRSRSKSRVDRSRSKSRVSRSRGGAHGEQIHQSGSRVRRYEEVCRKQVHHVISHPDGVREQVHLISREQIRRLSPFRKEVPHEQVRRESHKPAEFADCYLNHEHELKEVVGFNKRFTCDGCKEDGFKSRYRCERCNFDLHHECRFPKLAISPEINEELVFEFRPQPPTEKLCDACGKEIHGYFYNCQAKGMDLHPCCARLKAQVRNDDMFLVLRKKVSSECLWCRKKQPPGTEQGIPGWCYVSQCKKYNIHIFCITQMLHQAWQRGLMDGTGENSIRNINFQRLVISDGNRGGRGTEVALKIIGILRIVIGILLGDPSVFFGKLMFEFLEQLL